MNLKVYVILGFHINFYHSWRGDTPDEAGFGTDIRVIRRVLDILMHANQRGLQACAYWDSEVYWSFEKIIPPHCPDILDGIRERVHSGQDEIVVGPYNNGANHAATRAELQAALAWAIENPWGSGLKQLFGRVAPYYRPQECMLTTGTEQILHANGIKGLFLYYADTAFNTLSNFIPVLTSEQRFNPLWLRTRSEEHPLILLPCISSADLLEHGSLENLMLELHQQQRKGKILSDVVIHINNDADAENWLPFWLPRWLSWFPNSGGLEEFIRVVNKYPWASFCLPSEYIANHPPSKEIIVRQDLADGGFDGSYSWAEKFSSLQNWSVLERSRMSADRVAYLSLSMQPGLAQKLHQQLWEGQDSSFFQRLIGLSTTHFGMSTPLINEQRQAIAQEIIGNAERIAIQAEREAVQAQPKPDDKEGKQPLYIIEIFNYPRSCDSDPGKSFGLARIPVLLPVVQHMDIVNRCTETW